MLPRNILIAIFVAACCRNSSQRSGKYIQCSNDMDFKNAVNIAKQGIAIIIVTTEANHAVNQSIKEHFSANKKIQVNIDQGDQGACRRTVEYLGVDTINHTTSVRMMKDTYLVPNVLVVGFDPDALNAGYNIAKQMVTRNVNSNLKVSNQISHWRTEQPMPGTGPQAVPPGFPFAMPEAIPQESQQPLSDTRRQAVSPRFPFAMPEEIPPGFQQPLPDTRSQAVPPRFPFAMPEAIPPGFQQPLPDTRHQAVSPQFPLAMPEAISPAYPFAMPNELEAITAGKWTGSSSTPSQRESYDLTYQQRPVQIAYDIGTDEPTSEQPRSSTPLNLKTNKKIEKTTGHGAGSSRGPR